MNLRKGSLTFLLVVALIFAMVPVVWAQSNDKININKASVEELSTLTNIGATYAERIVQYREKNGPFKSPEELMKVKGIGNKTFELNKDKITVE